MNRKELKKRMLEKLDDDMPEDIIEKFLDFCFGTVDDIENEKEEIIDGLATIVCSSKEKSGLEDWPGPSPVFKKIKKGRFGGIGKKSGIGGIGGIGRGGGIGGIGGIGGGGGVGR